MDDGSLRALAAYYRADKPWKRGLFAKQREVLASRSLRKAVRCSRRSGKTVTASAALCDDLDQAGFDEGVFYAAKTRDVAERLVWGKLSAIAANVPGWQLSQSKLQIRNERGGYIQLVGLDKPAEIEKLRGPKMRAFHGDEPATYASLLRPLLDEIVEPALGDVRGSITFYGTPGPTLSGYWYEISSGIGDAWTLHNWTLRDNPHFRDADGYLAELLKKKGWDEFNPTYRREYMGEWCDDASARVYQYRPGTEYNDAGSIPQDYNEDWIHTIGCDFGVTDQTAFEVLASHPHDKTAYVIHDFAQSGLIIDDAADILLSLVRQYKPQILVGDGGGMGKSYIDFWNERRSDKVGMAMIPAQKREKRAQMDIINSDFRTRKLRLCQPACKALAAELQALPWEDVETKLREHPLHDNHRSDALLYAHRHHRAYMNSAPDGRKVGYVTPDSDDSLESEEREFATGAGRAWWNR